MSLNRYVIKNNDGKYWGGWKCKWTASLYKLITNKKCTYRYKHEVDNAIEYYKLTGISVCRIFISIIVLEDEE